ncbi:heptaprenyl diphosphate synthase component II [Paenibacillus ginsengarvi]|uniref:Heptaprenyl diphosphate synthase component II n=1 Tax=Paenibacillus ginsengarvi TaxID=400777 RepID=A0A3B0CJX0_9BACL|nr:heptaprenyl diphosphate synthase component II [Paenibacillus ginsengarvi]RKN84579.1 heptaprenyl diphosphate synthase component II [Paenibacillus ginsengarvi]
MKLMDIYARMKKDIAYVERELEGSVYTEHAMLKETSLHLLKAGGKRIRPVFVLLSSQFGRYDVQRIKHIAVPLELIHMATLVHDDVIDDADTRRGQLTVRSKWDNRIAMYTGDYIFAKALTVATELSNPRIHQILSSAIVELTIGEIEQIRYFFRTDQTLRHYLLRIKRKTALLIAISCQLGAVASEADEDVSEKLYQFGYNVGMAFQIRDDILDLTGTEKELGKPPGSDIRQGNITLPVLYALADPSIRGELLAEIERIRLVDGQTDVTPFLRMIRSGTYVQQADQLSSRYIDRAIEALSGLPSNRAKRDLVDIAHFIGDRSY